MRQHIHFYLVSLRAFLGPSTPLHLSVTDLNSNRRMRLIENQLLSAVRSELKDVDCGFDEHRTGGRGYYRDLCFHIHATSASGRRLELVDGGSVDWTRKLLSNAKKRLVISGIGSEKLIAEFGNGSAG